MFTHAALFVACVAFPALVTWIAPVTWVTLTRQGERVEARVKVCLFFIIPFRIEELPAVDSVDHHVRPGAREKLNMGNADDQRREITTESEGTLLLYGGDKGVAVHVSPASLEGTARDVREFLADRTRPELRFFAAANWKASVIVGGAVCLLTLLYLFVLVTALIHRITSSRRPAPPKPARPS